MRRSIATVSLSGTLEEKLEAAARAGFDAVELFENDVVGSPLSPPEIRRRTEELGLEVALYQPFRDFEAVPDDVLDRNLRRARHKFALMEQLGADTVLVCSSVAPEAIDDDALAAAQLRQLAGEAAEHGIRVAYEALAWGRHVADYEHAWRIVAAADHPALGVCLDSFHVLSRGSDPSGIRAIPGDKLFFLQLADAPYLAMDVLQWSRHYRCFPGQGSFDLAGFVGHVLAAGYRGPLSLEVFNDVFRRADPDRMAVDGLRSLLVLEHELGAHELPAPARLDGYAFVELGVGRESAPELEPLLHALGFEHRGPHRTKPVHLWEQGPVRVLLNHADEPAGGEPGIVALAVGSDDPERSAARAEALLAPILPRRRGPGEAELAGIAAPDGTSVFVCDDETWLHDFVPLEDPAAGTAGGLRRIDHVALSQPFDSFDEAALFYRSVLDLAPSPSQELAAPDGLVRSRPMADRDGGVRLVLTVPVLAGTAPPLGALQHVAFACDDVLAAARRMRDAGAPLLGVPDNYYDDLDARLGLDPALLEELRELGVLYDRDAGGELLHAFTATVGGRLFFEVLERRGGYAGYGAANSPVRLAAQRAGAAA